MNGPRSAFSAPPRGGEASGLAKTVHGVRWMRPVHASHLPRHPAGFAYVEVMVALMLVLAALVPALQALQTSVRGSQSAGSSVTRDVSLRAKMEEVLAQPFDTLNAETFLAGGNTTGSVSAAFSDAVSPERRIVILYRTDGSAPSSADTGLVRVRVAYEAGGIALETLKSKWW